MRNTLRVLLAAACAWALAATAADAPKEPCSVEVWADALFGPDGKLQTLDVPDANQHSPAFVERVNEPKEGGAAVRITGVSVGPRPIKRYAASQPDDIPVDVPTTVKVQCQVGAAAARGRQARAGRSGSRAETAARSQPAARLPRPTQALTSAQA